MSTPRGRLADQVVRRALEGLSRPGFSRGVGRVAQATLPAPVVQAAIRWYVDFYGVNTDEMERPVESYRSFDEFFTRRLRDGVHRLDPDPQAVVSPVDGRILNFGRVDGGRIDQIKGKSYSTAELLASAEDAALYARGSYVTIYLSPRDYHRIHSPIDGRVKRFTYVPGRLYPVNRTGVTLVDGLFAVNERLITYVESRHGQLAVVKVGATNVGMISVIYHSIRTNTGVRTLFDQTLRKSYRIHKGDELAMFHLGSTVVLLCENPELTLVPLEADKPVRMGQRLWTAPPTV